MSYDKTQDNPNLSQDASKLIESYSKISSELLGFFAVAVLLLIDITFYSYSHGDNSKLIFVVFLTSFLLLFIYIYFYLRTRKISKRLRIWNKSYFDQNYTIMFNTAVPKGKNEIANLFDLSKYIFPGLKYIYLESSPSFINKLKYFLFSKSSTPKRIDPKRILKAMNYNVNGYSFDFALKTERGYFIIKNFHDKIVNVDDILQLIQKAKDSFKNKFRRPYIYRILIVSKNYDDSFLEKESLERIMEHEIRTNLKIDLIVKEDPGYLVLWIDPSI